LRTVWHAPLFALGHEQPFARETAMLQQVTKSDKETKPPFSHSAKIRTVLSHVEAGASET